MDFFDRTKTCPPVALPAFLFTMLTEMKTFPLAACVVFILSLSGTDALFAAEPPVRDLKITLLSTNLAGNPGMKGRGEWGFSALVEVDGASYLFDTGHRPETVLNNAAELGLPLADITDVILSHNHIDHVGGLVTLRREWAQRSATALGRAHVARGALWSRGSRHDDPMEEWNDLIPVCLNYEALGGELVEHAVAHELQPGVWLSGPIVRRHDEQAPMRSSQVVWPDGTRRPDNVPEDMAMVFDTTEGLVVLAGCGHAGLINTLEHARQTVRPDAKIHAVVGGLHLAFMSEEKLDWTAEKLSELGLEHLHGGHCTGIAPVYHLRDAIGLPREQAVVGAVGATFELSQGITPLWIAR
ncbi:MAG: hypothetical protein SynsKO_35710 [Synoicihabitans sp.]